MTLYNQCLDSFFDIDAKMINDGLNGFLIGRVDAFDRLFGLILRRGCNGLSLCNGRGRAALRAKGNKVFSTVSKHMKLSRC